MKKLLLKQIRYRIIMCMFAVILTLGIVTGLGSAVHVQAEEKIPISSVEDFMEMQSNPSGSFYLTRDITLPEAVLPEEQEYMRQLFAVYVFKGTLDGRGHKLKNYTFKSSDSDKHIVAGLFGSAENATFKNLSLTDVNIDIESGDYEVSVYPFIQYADNCTFDNIKTSGKITVKSNAKDVEVSKNVVAVGGLIGTGENCKLINCSSSIKFNVNGGYTDAFSVSGLAGRLRSLKGKNSIVKNCSFSGDISASAGVAGEASVNSYIVAGICASLGGKVSKCINSGNITFKMQKKGQVSGSGVIGAYGIGRAEKLSSCGNTGKIKIDVGPKVETDHVEAAGLTGKVNVITKCWNKGSVSANGAEAYAGGLCIKTQYASQCYNKGEVSASAKAGFYGDSRAGGLCAYALRMQNCYNVGKVSLSGVGNAGGLSSYISEDYGISTCNYSTGAVSVKNGGPFYSPKKNRAALFPQVYDPIKNKVEKPKCYVYDNYYTASTGCTAYGVYGIEPVSKKAPPQAIKVSSITRKNCPKLSSKYWTYSSKYKRLILKNNVEK